MRRGSKMNCFFKKRCKHSCCLSRNSKCDTLCKTGGWHLKIAVCRKVLTVIKALLFSTWVFEDCLRGLFSSCCPMSWIVIPQYCQQVTRKPYSCFYNKNLLRVNREETFVIIHWRVLPNLSPKVQIMPHLPGT